VTVTLRRAYSGGEGEPQARLTKYPLYDEQGAVMGMGLAIDSPQSEQGEPELRRKVWAMEASSRCNRALVTAQSVEGLLRGVCEALVLQDRYRLALVAWLEQGEDHPVALAAQAGEARGYLEGVALTWDDVPVGQGPIGPCLREERNVNEPDLVRSQHGTFWRRRAERFGLGSALALPLLCSDGRKGALALYADIPHAFGEQEIALFGELADNLVFGLEALWTREAYQSTLRTHAAQALAQEKALADALEAIAATLEQRDPYTAGHQQHVAELSLRIGMELGLSANRLRGLYLAGIVHDLGKIQIPIEILNKSGSLTALEYELVKQHPKTAHDILKGVAFPWPIAEIIYQHHEYLDGSGYPRALAGEAILLEARILTVADIVESMSSDRPYRAALGIVEARREILRMRGSRLDPEVVDACVRILDRGEFVPQLL
ncbi:HD-GYP domain-containing protein, partial [Aeromonas sp. R9-1]|uniref:HD-GYP domain-containing protein n=1 Tax=Aeromonas sp. R9-1 TaxID=3138478 RepID=UPI0034A24233